jgi:hypothetical protein
MSKTIEKNVAEIIMVGLVAMILLSSCASTSPHHACGITPLNKQYMKKCR